VEWKLEVFVLPVSDMDRAKRFYAEQLGFHVDVDQQMGESFRVVQLTPPGSACSVSMVSSFHDMAPGTLKGLQLVVADVEKARQHLVDHGVEVSPVRNIVDGVWHDGHGGPWNSFVFFDDPDGNSWAVQEKPG
jgi:catechol 2,3-dioxygenase-like lactoylglutathione lyase family enzyme